MGEGTRPSRPSAAARRLAKLARSRAARRGWETRRRAARRRSAAARRGWETRRARHAARSRAARRGWRTRRIVRDFETLFELEDFFDVLRQLSAPQVEVLAFPSTGDVLEAPEDGHPIYTYAGDGHVELARIYLEPTNVTAMRVRDPELALVDEQPAAPPLSSWQEAFSWARSVYDTVDSSHAPFFVGWGRP